MGKKFTSLLLVEGRLLEARYFCGKLARVRADPFAYELNAFLSASRSVFELLRSEMARVPGFKDWWADALATFLADEAASFYYGLRNFSFHQGRVALVGGSLPNTRRWTYRFISNPDPVPADLQRRDVADCCREHLAKVAAVVLRFADTFPAYACPQRNFTVEGLRLRNLSVDDVEEMLGFPRGYTNIGPPWTDTDRLRLLGRSVDGVDFSSIRRMARYRARGRSAEGLLDLMADRIGEGGTSRDAVLEMIARQLKA